jgi:hypothetical protein
MGTKSLTLVHFFSGPCPDYPLRDKPDYHALNNTPKGIRDYGLDFARVMRGSN